MKRLIGVALCILFTTGCTYYDSYDYDAKLTLRQLEEGKKFCESNGGVSYFKVYSEHKVNGIGSVKAVCHNKGALIYKTTFTTLK